MKTMVFASRNSKEIVRDPINVGFGLGFPLIILLLLTAIQANVPVDIFEIDRLAPGNAVFGLSFISLFSGTLIAKDRSESFLMRLRASPMTAREFILGYAAPLLPLALLQSAVCFAAAFCLGLKPTAHVFMALVTLLPACMLYIGIGLLAGSVLSDKQVGGVCGALLTNLTAWLSGTWFDLSLVGGVFEAVANVLPFAHAVSAVQAALKGDYAGIFPHLWWVLGYAAVIMALAILAFGRATRKKEA